MMDVFCAPEGAPTVGTAFYNCETGGTPREGALGGESFKRAFARKVNCKRAPHFPYCFQQGGGHSGNGLQCVDCCNGFSSLGVKGCLLLHGAQGAGHDHMHSLLGAGEPKSLAQRAVWHPEGARVLWRLTLRPV
jgi:hypothetical protein